MSIITSTAAKLVGKAFALKTDQDLQMFDDLWEVENGDVEDLVIFEPTPSGSGANC